jgi:glutamate dehydrogenase
MGGKTQSTTIQKEDVDQFSGSGDAEFYRKIKGKLEVQHQKTAQNLGWLFANMHPYFFITMKQEDLSVMHLASRLHDIAEERKITLIDQDKKLIVARLDMPGSIYDTLKGLREREISYAEISHSYNPIPGIGRTLEIMRFEFERRSSEEITQAGKVSIPLRIRDSVLSFMKRLYPAFDFGEFDTILELLWLNNTDYVSISPAERIARVMHLYLQGKKHQGLYLDSETKEDESHHKESRILFSVGNPPQEGFHTQVSEVFQRLEIGVRRSYSLIINTGVHPYFLGTFYVLTHGGELVEKGSQLFARLKSELYNTQILSATSRTYTHFVANLVMTGEEASLTNSFIAFCHTVLAHSQPDRYDASAVRDAFHAEADITLQLIQLFKTRFNPDIEDREKVYSRALRETEEAINAHNTGHRYLDEIRKTVFRACLSFVRHTLKTNFYVPEKHALAFRMDPMFLTELGSELTSDLPQAKPFRITFFFTRYGVGYHIGFSDIARGGWRTIICSNHNEAITNLNSLFREVFVLAHTQHFKNKDIYQGGSKLTVVLDATDIDSQNLATQRLYKVQYGLINAFLDIFVTEKGKARNPRIVDYYGQDEPIELGPDENMHDAMIEQIAQLSLKRGYILGIGIMSSKRVGINHKEYGVTSRGVVKFAEIAMKEVGVDIHRDSFSIKFTGGPNGDVAGNSMRLVLDRCPRAEIRCIVDGTAGLCDPQGADREELARLLLKKDLDHFNFEALHSGGFILFRNDRRKDGVRDLYKKVHRHESSIQEEWVTTDEFHKEMEDLVFRVPADLFLPCGGRPETIDGMNWHKLFDRNGKASVRVITEGANSFITPEARVEIQKKGVIVLRDASANKCGVISSSYEIIANLLMTEKEFFLHKEAYVKDVYAILEKRAEEEAMLIFKRRREGNGSSFFTEISDAVSREINDHYSKLFAFFKNRPDLVSRPLFQKTILDHLPAFVRTNKKIKARVGSLPLKIQCAILASEIGTRIVYHGGWERNLESRVSQYLKEHEPI